VSTNDLDVIKLNVYKKIYKQKEPHIRKKNNTRLCDTDQTQAPSMTQTLRIGLNIMLFFVLTLTVLTRPSAPGKPKLLFLITSYSEVDHRPLTARHRQLQHYVPF
jgi:hypothetical protein